MNAKRKRSLFIFSILDLQKQKSNVIFQLLCLQEVKMKRLKIYEEETFGIAFH